MDVLKVTKAVGAYIGAEFARVAEMMYVAPFAAIVSGKPIETYKKYDADFDRKRSENFEKLKKDLN